MTADVAAFDADLLTAHRTALRALCEIIDHPALTGAAPASRPILQQLGLRLRGAVALLRTRPLAKTPAAPAPTPGRGRSTVQPEHASTAPPADAHGPALRSLTTTASAAARALAAAAGSPGARALTPPARRPAA